MKIVKKYNKLIRDKIPQIIKATGRKPFVRVLNKKEYLKELKKKIIEEGQELIRAKENKKTLNEVVDIQELLDVLAKQVGLTKLQIKKEQKIKNKKRGGFKKRLFLIKTEK